jgi:hypothetical protein
MGSYLEAYGSQEELRARRAHRIRLGAGIAALVLLVAAILYGSFRNYTQEHQVKAFLQLLRAGQYQDAYLMWGCSEATPCPNYPFPQFRQDWGPGSTHANIKAAQIGDVQSCGSGVLIHVNIPGQQPTALWVERATGIIGFAPFDDCPGVRHLRIGAFFKSLFGN